VNRRSFRFVGSVLALSFSACSKQTPRGLARASESAANSANVAVATAASLAHTVAAKPGCRALAVTGRATQGGSPIAIATLLDGEHWVELEAGASVALRHTLTSREFKLIGPGLVLPCRAGAEQLLLAKGRLSTSANLGVRPGAEVLIATPVGSVRYGDAALDLEFAEEMGLRVRVKQGEAWVEPEDRGRPRFKNPVASGGEVRVLAGQLTADGQLSTCQAAAELAEAGARRVLEVAPVDASASLGTRAAAHLRDRAQARVACAVAAAAAFATRDPAERQRLSASVAHADSLWQSIPHAVAKSVTP
jgi:hypothetical protein